MSSSTEKNSVIVKHRACDECRQRKLACSKDQGGCERCERENVACHYSEQKPMGRPRKQKFIGAVQTEPEEDQLSGTYQDIARFTFSAGDFDFDGTLAEPYYNGLQLGDATADLRTMKTNMGRAFWHFGDKEILLGPPIDFGPVNFGSGEDLIPPVDPVPQIFATVPNLSVNNENSLSQSTSALAPCSCLASMYLALASLQNTSSDIVAALATVRSAAITASNTLWCPRCGSVLLHTTTPPIESFQNTMLLGTILPIIANEYRRLLRIVDIETDRAVAAGEMKSFKFQDYGGIAARQHPLGKVRNCEDLGLLCDAVEMPPAQWRTMVRALLRVDIYGHEQPGFKHKGLKDLVAEMEYRQQTRHDIMDAYLDAGALEQTIAGHGSFSNGQCLGEKTRGCIEILRIGKVAIDNLVIA